MTSLWNSVTKKTTNFSSLKGNIKADIVIIGAGMAGILTAYLLQKKGYSCVILEAAKIGEGQNSPYNSQTYCATWPYLSKAL